MIYAICFAFGVIVGACGFYAYANHIFMKKPYFFRLVIEHKIKKLEENKSTEETPETPEDLGFVRDGDRWSWPR